MNSPFRNKFPIDVSDLDTYVTVLGEGSAGAELAPPLLLLNRLIKGGLVPKEWNVQVRQQRNGEGDWSAPIESDGPEIFSLTGGIHHRVKELQVTYLDGSEVRYTRPEED